MQAFWTELGHVLVKPQVNGQLAGWFILDTGASGLVIERDAADRMGLSSFGEVYVAGVGRKVSPDAASYLTHRVMFTLYQLVSQRAHSYLCRRPHEAYPASTSWLTGKVDC